MLAINHVFVCVRKCAGVVDDSWLVPSSNHAASLSASLWCLSVCLSICPVYLSVCPARGGQIMPVFEQIVETVRANRSLCREKKKKTSEGGLPQASSLAIFKSVLNRRTIMEKQAAAIVQCLPPLSLKRQDAMRRRKSIIQFLNLSMSIEQTY